jgi:hypothetical protein
MLMVRKSHQITPFSPAPSVSSCSHCSGLPLIFALEPQRLFKGPSQPKSTTDVSSRALLDKTPFANRAGAPLITPLPRGSKIAKIPFSVSQTALQTPGALLRPSSTRKHIRVPRSASKSFETPKSQGNHWDVSDISIEGPDTAAVNEAIEEEDNDEIEFMPPSAVGELCRISISFECQIYYVIFIRTPIRAHV